MAPALVLTFNLPEAAVARIRQRAAGLGVRVKAVPPKSFAMPIGGMAGIPVQPVVAPVERGGFSEPMLVMCNLDEDRFNRFLQVLRSPDLPRVPLKAVLTPHNVGWNALQLYEELRREHEAMMRGGRES